MRFSAVPAGASAPEVTPAVVSLSIPNHGSFAASAEAIDVTIDQFLPASAKALQRHVEERAGMDEGAYADVRSVTALLVVLAAISGYDERMFGRSFG